MIGVIWKARKGVSFYAENRGIAKYADKPYTYVHFLEISRPISELVVITRREKIEHNKLNETMKILLHAAEVGIVLFDCWNWIENIDGQRVGIENFFDKRRFILKKCLRFAV